MLTVACVLSQGPGAYHRSHVERLAGMVDRHMAQPFTFACVTDSPWLGWWAKISLFEPGRFTGRVLYLDLDVDVVGPLDDLADFDAPFTIIRDWNVGGVNSSVMAWDAGAADRVFEHFTPKVMGRMRGDQDWIGAKMLSAAKFPREWCVSYKKHVRPTGRVPEGARVVCYHGRPKPWELQNVA